MVTWTEYEQCKTLSKLRTTILNDNVMKDKRIMIWYFGSFFWFFFYFLKICLFIFTFLWLYLYLGCCTADPGDREMGAPCFPLSHMISMVSLELLWHITIKNKEKTVSSFFDKNKINEKTLMRITSWKQNVINVVVKENKSELSKRLVILRENTENQIHT